MLTFHLAGLLCHVEGPPDERQALYQRLAVFDQDRAKYDREYKYGVWDGWVRLYNPEDQIFLSGMYLLAIEKVEAVGISVQVTGERLPAESDTTKGTEVPPDLLPGRTLRDYQRRAIRKALFHRGGVLELPTASGKTLVSAGLIKVLNLPTVFCVHQKNLLRQTARAFEQYGLRGVGMIGDSIWEPNDITVATIQTLHASLRRYDDRAAKFLRSREVMLFDETHHLSAPSWRQVVEAADVPYRYGLSGTPFRSRDLKRYEDYLLLGLCGGVCCSVSPSTLISQGWIAKPTIYMVYISGPAVQGSGKKYTALYQAAIVEHEERNKRALAYATRFSRLGLRTLILVRAIKHGVYLLHELQRRGVRAAFLKGGDEVYVQKPGARTALPWGVGSGAEVVEDAWDVEPDDDEYYIAEVELEQDVIVGMDSKTLLDFQDGETPVLIGSTVMDEGVDMPEVEVLLNLSGGRSSVKTRQRLGRSMRPKKGDNRVTVLDFYDRQHDLTRRHSADRQREYRMDGHTVLREQDLDSMIEGLEGRGRL
jgi:superfamily II DNA or RNA helicase